MKTSHVVCIGALAGLGFAAAAQAETFTYRLTQYPATVGNCHEVAKALGERFTQLSGVTLARAYCADVGPDGYDLRFDYDAEQELAVASTVDRLVGPDAQDGIFATREQCDAALANEVARFEAATGLKAFVSYCHEDDFPAHLFAMHIDAFGDPAVRPRFGSAYVFGDPVDITAAEIESQVLARLLRSGVNASYVSYETVVGDGSLAFLYYADAAVSLVEAQPVRVPTKNDCLATIQRLRPLYESDPSSTLAVFCAYHDVYRAYDVVTLSLGHESLHGTDSAEHFKSQAECEAARPGLAAYYSSELGRLVVTSACSFESDDVTKWRVVMFERP